MLRLHCGTRPLYQQFKAVEPAVQGCGTGSTTALYQLHNIGMALSKLCYKSGITIETSHETNKRQQHYGLQNNYKSISQMYVSSMVLKFVI